MQLVFTHKETCQVDKILETTIIDCSDAVSIDLETLQISQTLQIIFIDPLYKIVIQEKSFCISWNIFWDVCDSFVVALHLSDVW